MNTSDLSPSELVLASIGFATFPPPDWSKTVRAGVLWANGADLWENGHAFQRIALKMAVRGDGILFRMEKETFWGLVIGITGPLVAVLSPAADGLIAFAVDSVRVSEVRRYVS